MSIHLLDIPGSVEENEFAPEAALREAMERLTKLGTLRIIHEDSQSDASKDTAVFTRLAMLHEIWKSVIFILDPEEHTDL